MSEYMNKAYYHLPGLFEFFELYRIFLPLFREHREYFYDWCDIASIYGAPEGCLWGGGREGVGDTDAEEVLALMKEYGISSRLTFSNSLLRPEHLANPKCNALCTLFEKQEPRCGVIVHSDLLLNYLKEKYPGLYFVSSTTKVLTEFDQLKAELDRPEFEYVVPDFRLNKAYEDLETLTAREKDKVEFLCNECCWVGCRDRKACYESVSRINLELYEREALDRAELQSDSSVWFEQNSNPSGSPEQKSYSPDLPEQKSNPAGWPEQKSNPSGSSEQNSYPSIESESSCDSAAESVHVCKAPHSAEGYRFSRAMKSPAFIGIEDIQNYYLPKGFSNFKLEGRTLGSAIVLEFLLYYMTKPEYQLKVREAIYLDSMLDLF